MSILAHNLKQLQCISERYTAWCNKNRSVKISDKLSLSFHASANCVYAKIFTSENKKYTYFLTDLHLLCEMKNQIFYKFIANQRQDLYKIRFAPNLDITRGQGVGQQDRWAINRVKPDTGEIILNSVLVMSINEYNKLQAFLKYAKPSIKQLLMQRKTVEPVENEEWYTKTGPLVSLQWTNNLPTMWDIVDAEVIIIYYSVAV